MLLQGVAIHVTSTCLITERTFTGQVGIIYMMLRASQHLIPVFLRSVFLPSNNIGLRQSGGQEFMKPKPILKDISAFSLLQVGDGGRNVPQEAHIFLPPLVSLTATLAAATAFGRTLAQSVAPPLSRKKAGVKTQSCLNRLQNSEAAPICTTID